jgi:hypothetical protein
MLTHGCCETILLHGMFWQGSRPYFCVCRGAFRSEVRCLPHAIANLPLQEESTVSTGERRLGGQQRCSECSRRGTNPSPCWESNLQMKTAVFWDVAQFSPVDTDQRFRGAYYLITPMMEAVSSNTSVNIY